MLTSDTFIIGGGLVLLVVQSLLAFSLIKALRRLQPIEQRVAHFGDALSLLTETSEAGFKAVATEVERWTAGAGGGGPVGRTTTARVATAARSGRSVQEIAAGEQVAESEVSLRLNLAEQASAVVVPAAAEQPPEVPALPAVATVRKVRSRPAVAVVHDKKPAPARKASAVRPAARAPRTRTNGAVRA